MQSQEACEKFFRDKHPHYNNFVLLFDRNEHDTPIITTPPRVYLIDFDQAEMKLPKL